MSFNKINRRNRIKKRIRKVIIGTNKKPRLSVFRSNKEIYSQIIDDSNGETIISASSRDKLIIDIKNSNKVLIAENVGKLLAEKALKKGIKDVVFDRGGYLYHGRVKSLAQGARSGGLKF
jgi:large subunit ribosomal protein L18